MAKAIWLFCGLLVASACGAGSPTAPSAPGVPPIPEPCTPQTPQCLVDGAILNIIVNGVTVSAGTTQSGDAILSYSFRIDYTNTSRENVWLGLLFARDDGMERLSGCIGLGGGFINGGATFASQDSSKDTMFAPGHAVTVSLVAMFGPSPSQGMCALRTSTGALNRAVVQGERHLVTLVVR